MADERELRQCNRCRRVSDGGKCMTRAGLC